jgi:hypothetical protein
MGPGGSHTEETEGAIQRGRGMGGRGHTDGPGGHGYRPSFPTPFINTRRNYSQNFGETFL